MDTKVCKTCGIEKPLDNFKKGVGYVQGRIPHCKPCFNASIRDRGVARRYHLKRKYGITPEQYDTMTANGCNVCGSFENLHVDHDHACCPEGTKTCGQCVRGVLCQSCNHAEGLLKSDPDRAMALAFYMIRTCSMETV